MKRITLNDEILWRYAQLCMADVIKKENASQTTQLHYMIRARIFYGLRAGKMKISSFFKDEILKIEMKGCCYCGCQDKLSMDHIIPRKKLGSDLSENLLPACKHCNSSKGAKDLLEWMRLCGKFPSIFLIRRYLKLVYFYCEKENLLSVSLEEARNLELPFSLKQMESTLDYLYYPLQLDLTQSVILDEKLLEEQEQEKKRKAKS